MQVSGKTGQAVRSTGAPGSHLRAPTEACVPRAQQAEGAAAEDGYRDTRGDVIILGLASH